MAQVPQGGQIRLTVTFYETLGGPLVDPVNPTLDILFENVSVLDSPVTYSNDEVVRDSIGVYHYSWSVPVDAELGEYIAEWSAVLNTVEIGGIEIFQVVTPGSGVTGYTLGSTYILEFGGEFDPLYVDPELIHVHFPDAGLLEIAELVHYFSKQVDRRLGPNDEPSYLELDYIFAATACSLSKIYDPLGVVGDGISFRLGDLSVTNRSMPRQSINRANAYTWCELAAALRVEVLSARVGMKAVVAGSAYKSPIPSRQITVPTTKRPHYPQYGTSDDSKCVPGEF